MSGSNRHRMVGALVVGCVAAAYFAAFVGYGVNLEDEGLLLLQITRTARGEIPYVDFHTGYTPGAFYLNAALVRWFGESVIPIRIVLVGVNATAVALIYLLAQPFAGRALAAAAALGFAAFLPAFVGEFASFNIPYPAWYAAVLFLVCQVAVDRHVVRGGRGWLVAAGLTAGIAFGFKPNAGVLATLAIGTSSALLRAGDQGREGRLARWLLALGLAVVLAAFSLRVWLPEFWLIAGPLVVLMLGAIRRARGRVVADDGDGLGREIAWVAAGVLVVTLPWIGWFVGRLGVAGFLREVLLLGSHADLIYATPYPVPLGFPAGWPILCVLGLAAVAWLGRAIERGRVRLRVAVAVMALLGAAGAVALAAWAHVPEGLLRSITWQVQHVGFYALPLMHLGLSILVVRRLQRDQGAWSLARRRLLVAIVFAEFTYVELYPRVDTMHLILAMPASLVVAAAVAARLAQTWARALGKSSAVLRGTVAVAGMLLGMIAIAPVIGGRIATWRGDAVGVGSARLPIVLETARATDLRAFDAMLDYLRGRLAPGEAIFGFPAMGLVPFALGHATPTTHDYFFPGRPDHAAEAEIVEILRAAPPRYVVTLNRRLGFFSESPAYYFLLRGHVREHYRLAARFGRYDVLCRRELPAEPVVIPTFEPPPLPGGVFARLGDPDREQRRAGILDVLARLAAGTPLEEIAPDRREQLLVMRNIAEAGDGRGLLPAWHALHTASWRVKGEAAGALNFLALHSQLGRYLWSPDVAAAAAVPPPGLDEIDPQYLRFSLVRRGRRGRLGVFAAWVLTERREASGAGVFRKMLATERRRPYFRVVGAQGLWALGDQSAANTLVDLLAVREHATQNLVPSILLGAPRDRVAVVAEALSRGLSSDEPLEREVSGWVAGAGRFSETEPALRAAVRDADAPVRTAASWALRQLGEGRME